MGHNYSSKASGHRGPKAPIGGLHDLFLGRPAEASRLHELVPYVQRPCATNAKEDIDVKRRSSGCDAVRKMEGPILRSRPAGGDCKPPQAASVKSRGCERCGKGAARPHQV